jgi:hypothetical protein
MNSKIKINDNFLRFKLLNIIAYLFSIIIVLGILYIGLWELNIFKKEATPPAELESIKNELENLNKLNFNEMALEIKNKLPQPQVLAEPTLTSEMIGKINWFE